MSSKLLLTILSILILIVANLGFQVWGRAQQSPSGEVWKVTRVLSGQNLTVKSNSGLTNQVRLQGISAPWKEQEPWGSLARQRLEELVKDRPVTLEFDSLEFDLELDRKQKARGDRLQAYVWQGNTLVNAQLVKEGYVVTDAQNIKYESELQMLESEARLLELGIWNPKSPMRIHPRDFRRQLLR